MSNNFKQTMKLFTSVALCISMLLGAFILPAAAENDFTVEVGSVTAFPGETVSIPLTFANNVDVAALILTPDADEGLTIDDVTLEGSLFDTVTVGLNLMFDGDPEAPIRPASGTFAVLTVTVADDCAAGTYDLSVIVRECVDSWYENVACTVVPGTVTVVTATPTKAAASAGHDAYSLDGENWQTSPVFTGLYPSTEYTVSVKDGETVTTETVTTADPESYTTGEVIDSSAAVLNVEGFKFTHSLALESNLGLNFFVTAALMDGYSNIRLYIEREVYSRTDGTRSLKAVILDNPVIENNKYKFAFKDFAAAEIGNMAYATLYAEKDGETFISPVDAYSVRMYAEAVLASNSAAFTSELKTALVAMLDYGAAAQTYFSYNTANPVNAGVTAAQRSLYTYTGSTEWTNITDTIALEGATASISGKALGLDNNIELKLYMSFDFTPDEDTSLAYSYISLNGREYESEIGFSDFVFDTAKDKYYARITDIAVANLSAPVSCTICQNGTPVSETLVFNAESYTYLIDQYTAPSYAKLQAVLNAMMVYSRAAYDYFKK